jgi:hypothetical protein
MLVEACQGDDAKPEVRKALNGLQEGLKIDGLLLR